MADIIAGIAPQIDTHANWVSLNPTLGKDSGGKSYGQIIFSTASPVGDIMVWGNDQTYTAAYTALQYYIQPIDTVTVTASATVGGESVVNVNTGTATITIPSGLPVGTRKTIRKISSTAGTVTIARSSTDVFTRASLTSVTLTSDGDFWVLEKVSATRWELVDGVENINTATVRYPSGIMEYRETSSGTTSTSITGTFGSTSGGLYYVDVTFTFGASFISTPDFTFATTGSSCTMRSMVLSFAIVRIFYQFAIERVVSVMIAGRWYT